MRELLGRHHPTIRRLRALRRDGALRRAESVLLAEGIHLAREALASGVAIELALAAPRLARTAEGRALIEALERRGLERLETADAVLDSLADARSPQPIVLLVRRPERTLEDVVRVGSPPALVAVACGLQDPGNLGGLIRTAEAAGATGCIVCGESADPFHPRAVRASAGSILRLPVVTLELDLALARLRGAGLVLVAADPAAAVDYDRVDLTRPTALFFGTEGQGLPPALAEQVASSVRVPLSAGVDSLSVGAAAAVLLFEAARQRRAQRAGP